MYRNERAYLKSLFRLIVLLIHENEHLYLIILHVKLLFTKTKIRVKYIKAHIAVLNSQFFDKNTRYRLGGGSKNDDKCN